VPVPAVATGFNALDGRQSAAVPNPQLLATLVRFSQMVLFDIYLTRRHQAGEIHATIVAGRGCAGRDQQAWFSARHRARQGRAPVSRWHLGACEPEWR
jgi:hypothetical protein